MTQHIIQGDCLVEMKKMADKSFDLVLTDPPYGIGAGGGVGGFGSSKTDKHYKDGWDSRTPPSEVFTEIMRVSKHYKDGWDSRTPPSEVFTEIMRVSKHSIIFGGQFFTDKLPPNGHWIVWDKKGAIAFDNPFGDCELAWTNLPRKSVKKYTVIQQGFVAEERDRWHPTQKPVSLFKAIIMDYSEDERTILDPFLGSGTTLVAAKQLNRNAVGIEISPEYCEIARKRLEQSTLL